MRESSQLASSQSWCKGLASSKVVNPIQTDGQQSFLKLLILSLYVGQCHR